MRPTEESLERLRAALAPRFHVEHLLAEGGMGSVYRATETALQRTVAIKLLRADLAAAISSTRFEREIRLAATLQHPHLVPVLATGVLQDFHGPGRTAHWYSMPFVEGESLRSRLATQGQLGVADAVAILRDIGRALAYAHAHGVIHRDIKPDNVMLTGSSAQLTDFGIAKALDAASATGDATTVGVALGTPAYMSPEQAAADPGTDHRTDIYALGAVGYEMLTGSAPFGGVSRRELMAAVATQEPPPLAARRPDVPPALAALLEDSLRKDPDLRPPTADAFLERLEGGTTPGHLLAGAARLPAGGGAWHQRVRVLLMLGAAGAAAGAAWLALRSPAPPTGPRIAVLPFSERGCAVESRLGEGLTDEVTARLARVAGLNVMARMSAQRSRTAGTGAAEFGRMLGVDYVLDGSVACSPGASRVRVIPALVRVRDEAQVWGAPYEADTGDPFRLQAHVAEQVAEALQGRLTDADRSAVRRAPTTSLSAHDAYVVGRSYWRSRAPDSVRRAAVLFREAIGLDSSFARAWAGLADVYVITATWGMVAGPTATRAAFDSAEWAARRALAIDSGSAQALTTLAQVMGNRDANAGEAERWFRRAIAIDSNYATAYQWLSELMVGEQRPAEAVAAASRAASIEPLTPAAHIQHAAALAMADRHRDAMAALDRVMALAPPPNVQRLTAHLRATLYYLPMQRWDSAGASLAQAYGPAAALWTQFLAAIRDPGRHAEARGMLAADPRLGFTFGPGSKLRDDASTQAWLRYMLGDRDSALALLRGDGSLRSSKRNELLTNPLWKEPAPRAWLREHGVS